MKKKCLLLLMVATVFATGMVFGAGEFTNIKVQMNSLKVFVNGKQVTSPNIVYNGTTYVPLRAVSDGLGQAVDYDAVKKVVNIGEFKAEDSNVLDPKKTTLNTPVSVDELVYNIRINPPDSIGTVYMEATVKNNSKYALGSYQIAFLNKETNERGYLSMYGTLLPGETSPKFDTFGPKSQNINDIQILGINYSLVDSNGKKTYVDYDAKLKTYKVY